jgi:hypothetical protein
MKNFKKGSLVLYAHHSTKNSIGLVLAVAGYKVTVYCISSGKTHEYCARYLKLIAG